jgi:amino acid transporter
VCVCVCVCVCDRSYTGFDNLGTIAGEVINPSYTYPRGVVGALLIIAVSMSMPIIVSSLVADRVCACACACVYA